MKKLSIKTATLAMLSSCFAMSLIASGIAMKSTTANAAVTVGADNIASEGFVMEKGASIKDIEGEFGIRWQTTVSQAFTDYVTTNYPNATTIEYKTLVTGLNQLETGAITELDMDTPNKAILEGTLADDGTYVGAILYAEGDVNEGQWESIKEAAYKSELVARACVIIDDTTVIYAQAEDTQRSMRGVAAQAKVSNDENADNVFVDDYTTKTSAKASYYDEQDNTMDVSADLNGKTFTAYANGKLVGEATVENGKITLGKTLDVAAVVDATKAENVVKHTLNLFEGDSRDFFTVSFIKPTEVIRSAEDLSVFAEADYTDSSKRLVYNGYYVLANNIDASAYTSPAKELGNIDLGNYKPSSSGSNKTYGLMGTFDGNGYTINGLTVNEGGLFGIIGTKATVKNVGFTNAKINVTTTTGGDRTKQRLSGLLAAEIYHYATVENVYIEIVDFGTVGARGALAASINNNAYLKNILVVDNDGKTTDYPVANGTAVDKSGTRATDYATLLGVRTPNVGYDSGRREVIQTDWQNVFMYSTQRMAMFGELNCRFWSLAEKEDLLNGESGTGKQWNDVANFCAGLTQGTFRYIDWADLKAAYTNDVDETASLRAGTSAGATVKTEWNVKTSVDTFSSDFWAYNAETGELSWKGATA